MLLSCLRERQESDEGIALLYRLMQATEASGNEIADSQMALDLNKLSVLLRNKGQLGEAEALARKALAIDERARGEDHPKIPHRLSNLSVLLIMNGKHDEARQTLEHAWRLKGSQHDLTSARILFFSLGYALLCAQPAAEFVGRLKTILSWETIPDYADVVDKWNIDIFLEYLRGILPAESCDFMSELSAVLNQEAPVSSLDRFSIWRSAPVLALAE
jgi:hypothetical protein